MLEARSFLLLLSSAYVVAHGDANAAAGQWVRPATPATVKGTDLDYQVAGKTYEGYSAIPASGTAKAGVLIAHQYMGLTEYEKARADEMAKMGYAAFALDVYGKGVRCTTSACASAAMNKALSNITSLRDLISAGTSQLLSHGAPRPDKLVAMGYCFGGSMVLELARHPAKGASAGVSFAAVSSIHGTLGAYAGETTASGEMTGRVQVHHAELDFQGDGALLALEAELKVGTNGTDAVWETLKYGKCKHGWTEPMSSIYNARAAVQAHKSTFEFFEMALGFYDPAADAFPELPFCQPK